jgi:predicted RNase H-like nuclease (RuvC/YqgF family)
MPETKPTLEAQMKRLDDARRKVESFKGDRQRLEGKIEAQKKALDEINEKCQEKFGCGVDGLPALAESLETEAEQMLASAEKILSGKK